MAHVWAAYRKEALASMGEDFADGQMSAADFKGAFEDEVRRRYDGVWTLFADTVKGYRPIGLVLGFWPNPDSDKSPFMIIGDMVWFPWASARNRIAAAVNFFNTTRDTIPMVDFARQKDRPFFEVMMAHGVMRQVGTSQNVYRDQPAAVYETRRRTTS